MNTATGVDMDMQAALTGATRMCDICHTRGRTVRALYYIISGDKGWDEYSCWPHLSLTLERVAERSPSPYGVVVVPIKIALRKLAQRGLQ